MKGKQFKHNLEKAKRQQDQKRYLDTIARIDKSIEKIQKLNKIINK
jgi:hypothetical protein